MLRALCIRKQHQEIEQLIPERLVGRDFSAQALECIREEANRSEAGTRAAIARRVCQRLEWYNAKGDPKLMSARVALLRLHRLRLIQLPKALNANGNGRGLSPQKRCFLDETPIIRQAGDLNGLRLIEVQDRKLSALWNGLIARYHYLGYTPLPGAQKRYLVEWEDRILAALGFGASAWKVAARDDFVGWAHDSIREKHLHLILNNGRFLILPWVQCRNLASKVLSLAVRRLPSDFERTYGYRPLLLETFVEKNRFEGSCYRAANWICVGQTRGRGKKDRWHNQRLPIKDVWVYPMVAKFRQLIGAEGANPEPRNRAEQTIFKFE